MGRSTIEVAELSLLAAEYILLYGRPTSHTQRYRMLLTINGFKDGDEEHWFLRANDFGQERFIEKILKGGIGAECLTETPQMRQSQK